MERFYNFGVEYTCHDMSYDKDDPNKYNKDGTRKTWDYFFDFGDLDKETVDKIFDIAIAKYLEDELEFGKEYGDADKRVKTLEEAEQEFLVGLKEEWDEDPDGWGASEFLIRMGEAAIKTGDLELYEDDDNELYNDD